MVTWEEQKESRRKYLLKKHNESPLISCACGCGEIFHEISTNGKKRKYVSGHNGRKYEHGTNSNVERRKKLMEESPFILCACGCGQKLKAVNMHGIPVKYIHGHKVSEKYRTQEEKAAQSKIRYRNNKIKAINTFGGCCAKCGISYDGKNAAIFQFHHLDPSEKESILAKKFNGSFEKALEELKKCILLCSNCHALEHSEGF